MLGRSIKLIGIVGAGLCLYVWSIVQCASQTPDSIAIPKAAWEQLEDAINSISSAIKEIRTAPSPTISSPTQPTAIIRPSPTPEQTQPATAPMIPTPQVYLEGTWFTEQPKERVTITSGFVEDRSFHDGQLSLESDGIYALTDKHHKDDTCYYNIALSADYKKMFWAPAMENYETNTRVALGCRPATIFHRIRDCCVEERRRESHRTEHAHHLPKPRSPIGRCHSCGPCRPCWLPPPCDYCYGWGEPY